MTGLPAQAFHSILEHDVIDRNVFDSYYEAKEMLGRYFSHYNNYRLHRSIGFITARRPGLQQKWEEAEEIHDTTTRWPPFQKICPANRG